MYKRLIIISDTAIYRTEGEDFAFGPVVRELEFIESLFDEIIWIGFNREDKINDLSMQKIQSSKIKTVLLTKIGGKGFLSLMKIILQYPVMFFTILKYVRKGDIIHTRAPSHPALIAVLLSFVYKNKIWWNKYAGNWNQKNPPLSYGFQRWLFKKAKHTNVTINGFWYNQPKHCYSFENPCLTQEDIEKGKEITQKKTFEPPFVFAFAGRMEDAKGVSRIIEALKSVPFHQIKEVHFIGDGKKTETYIKQSEYLGDKVLFHGFLDKTGVHNILKKTDFFILPSTASEGFPKVIAEAACYGAVPVVSNVGSIAHYVNENNGFIWDLDKSAPYSEILHKAVQADTIVLKQKSLQLADLAEQFTFQNYLEKLENKILSFKK